ncbi:MAG: hypothetical protein J7503_13815 [Cellulomonas iranensis]|uniref:hypothetical protein n=1 Tax=Cellulomonas iranensis TaxID=76862 RepID=UPI001B217605|nr:hypothetical protein [Cellulomonas iranensis]MBO9569883.1 hypothetical protein [Cellulomonas iranensis]
MYERAVVPPAERGRRWSNYNVNGRVVVRRDLPKAPKTVGGWEVPNFGDWKKGSHVHSATIMAYPRETWFAQRLPIVIDVAERVGDVVPVGFRVDRVFDRTDLVERDLHLACSLLRESVGGHVSVVPTDVSVADWLADQRVTWEFLPRGEATFERVVSRLRVDPSDPRVREAGERFVAIDSMRPGAVVVGDGEFSRYFGFKFREDLVALECLDYGNALYLMYEDWQVLGQRTRIDLLADENADYDRVVHRKGWQDRLRALLALRGHAVDGG